MNERIVYTSKADKPARGSVKPYGAAAGFRFQNHEGRWRAYLNAGFPEHVREQCLQDVRKRV